jgi:hypothetical protein
VPVGVSFSNSTKLSFHSSPEVLHEIHGSDLRADPWVSWIWSMVDREVFGLKK